jgi:hypothetical protein
MTSSDITVGPVITNGIRNSPSISIVGIGATLRQTTIVPSDAYCIATIDEASMPTKSSGTVRPHRLISSEPPHRSSDRRTISDATVNAIWSVTIVSGSGSRTMASLLKMDMPAEATMYAAVERIRSVTRRRIGFGRRARGQAHGRAKLARGLRVRCAARVELVRGVPCALWEAAVGTRESGAARSARRNSVIAAERTCIAMRRLPTGHHLQEERPRSGVRGRTTEFTLCSQHALLFNPFVCFIRIFAQNCQDQRLSQRAQRQRSN